VQVLTLSLEDLVFQNRIHSLKRVLSFLQIENDSKIEKYFETEVTSEKVRQGRWRNDVSDVATFNARYFAIVAELKKIDPQLPLKD
jgi:hypothetical protein